MNIKVLTLVVILFSTIAYTQTVPPPVPPPPPPGLPINFIAGALFLLGVIYGSKKINKDSNS